MSTELVVIGGRLATPGVDEHPGLTDAERYALRWLYGYNVAKTRNAYAVDIGLPNHIRVALPGGPSTTKELPVEAWLPWATRHGIEPCGELTTEQVQTWVHVVNQLHPGSKNVRRRRWYALCGYYAYLRREQVVYCDPDALLGGRQGRKNMGLGAPDPSATVPLTADQTRALHVAAQLDGTQHRERNRALIAVLTSTAARAEELVDLDLEDVHRQGPGRHALVQLDGKGDKKRWQKLPAADLELVDAYLAVRVPPAPAGTVLALPGEVTAGVVEQPLFTTSTGARLHVDTIAPLLRRIANLPQVDDSRQLVRWAALELAPIKDTLRPHQCRHGYAVTASKNGVPIKQVQVDLGHAALTTTQGYLHADETGEHSAAQVVSDIYHGGDLTLPTKPEAPGDPGDQPGPG